MALMKRLLEDPELLALYKKNWTPATLPTITVINDNDRDLVDDLNSDICKPNTYFGQSNDYELVEDASD